jgi:hypothetical protein
MTAETAPGEMSPGKMFSAKHVSAETSAPPSATPPAPARQTADWTAFEDLQLTQRRAIGEPYAQIAGALGRSESAVRVRACKIGIAKRNDRTRARNARRARTQTQPAKG